VGRCTSIQLKTVTYLLQPCKVCYLVTVEVSECSDLPSMHYYTLNVYFKEPVK